MKKSILAVLLAISVIAIGVVAWLAQKDSTPAVQNSTTAQETEATDDITRGEMQQHIITYTDAGFSPADITINQGGTVVFRNQSSSTFQPASDQHPTHTVYSDFDPRRGIEPGGEYRFTFERTGSWGYHDHLNPGATGTITVQ